MSPNTNKQGMWRGNHNISECYYHIQLTIKYRRPMLSKNIEQTILTIFKELNYRYDIEISQAGFDSNHIHIMVQHLPSFSTSQVIKIIKSITAREVFKKHPEIKKILWGGNFWTSGYYVGTISSRGNIDIIKNYIKKQGLEREKEQKRLKQLTLFNIEY